MRARLGGGLLESVKIDDDHIDRRNAMFGDGRAMSGIFAPMQNAAMHFGMQRLDATIQHLGKARELGNVFDGDARFAQQFRSSAG